MASPTRAVLLPITTEASATVATSAATPIKAEVVAHNEFNGWTRISSHPTWGDYAIGVVNGAIWMMAIGVGLWAIHVYGNGGQNQVQVFDKIGSAMKWTVISTTGLAMLRAAYSAIDTASQKGKKEGLKDFAGTTITLIVLPPAYIAQGIFKAGCFCCHHLICH